MVWALPLLPLIAGAAIWTTRPAWGAHGVVRARERVVLAATATLTLGATLAVALWAAASHPDGAYGWGGGLILTAEVDTAASIMAVLVPTIALAATVYAAVHEPRRGLTRLVVLLLAFAGAMELLVVAGDLLTLLIGWEVVGAISWALIGHDWYEPDKPAAAAHAFNATRFGDLGLFIAAAATFAATGSLRYADVAALDGAALHVAVAGIVLAAAAKSAQLPFAPWLFSAMGGPTPVSALLHAAAMVAAGAYLLARLEPALSRAWWFGPAVLGIGLVTALGGGVVAALQPHAKKLLAASTSAQYGLMFVAVGAGSAAAGLAHLVAHAAFKALLFLSAGVAIGAAGSQQLAEMRLGRSLPVVAVLTATGSLALAAVPPLGAAFTKEAVVAAAGHRGLWLVLIVILAGAFSAFYAARFQLLAYGPTRGNGAPGDVDRPGWAETAPIAYLALLTVALGVVWLPGAQRAAGDLLGGELPKGQTWELALSLVAVAAGAYAAVVADRRGHLATLGTRRAADWFGLPALVEGAVIRPTLVLCAALARFDEQVVDAGVRTAAAIARGFSRLASRFSERGVDGIIEA
ncbi:MAG: NADH-quinone oxidoreductase subunit L, partial [Actinomycetota bacterium]|nr:NADH-quinone oxidoreductase subunit L [Actinomycetota bacterium]